ncbi:hypothetical protein L3i20_v243800 [Paenibacillus sp. L3-i20]|nr:hypothetical protein L3i20_v243800 [Paenibacillus sp. L3-i20]
MHAFRSKVLPKKVQTFRGSTFIYFLVFSSQKGEEISLNIKPVNEAGKLTVKRSIDHSMVL